MATKVTVNTDLGSFSRRTVRTYSHIVVVIEAREVLEARRLDSLANAEKALVYYAARPEEAARGDHQARYTARIAELSTPIAADGAPYVLGWTGRLDLAVKLAAQARGYREVRIYAVDGTRVR